MGKRVFVGDIPHKGMLGVMSQGNSHAQECAERGQMNSAPVPSRTALRVIQQPEHCCASVLTARERALGFAGNTQGLTAHPTMRVYCSAHAHSSVDKAVRIAGIGDANLIKVPVQGTRYGMDLEALESAIVSDKVAGLVPAAIVACLGGTSVGACDDISGVAAIARRMGSTCTLMPLGRAVP